MKTIDTFQSTDGSKKAIILEDSKLMWINFFHDGQLISSETYQDKSLRYYEDAAENYVSGIKKI